MGVGPGFGGFLLQAGDAPFEEVEPRVLKAEIRRRITMNDFTLFSSPETPEDPQKVKPFRSHKGRRR